MADKNFMDRLLKNQQIENFIKNYYIPYMQENVKNHIFPKMPDINFMKQQYRLVPGIENIGKRIYWPEYLPEFESYIKNIPFEQYEIPPWESGE